MAGRLKMWIMALIVVNVLSSGCGTVRTRTVLVPEGEPIQLAESVMARVYVFVNGERVQGDTRVSIPEGWWCLPDPGPE